MEYREYTAKSVDEAITKACLELGVTSDRLDYSVVQESKSGFMGIGAKPAVIKAREKAVEEPEKEEPKPIVEEKKVEEKTVETPAPAAAPVSERKEEGDAPKSNFVSNDEIEKRAAAAAARARANGTDETRSERSTDRRPDRRSDRNGRYGKKPGRYGNDRKPRNSRYDRQPEIEIPDYVPSQPKPERVVTPKTEEEVTAITRKAVDFLTDVFHSMGLHVDILSNYDQKEGSLNMTFSGDEMGILIGKRGQTLDSLQYLTSLVINKGQEEYTRVKLDTEDYRGRREETLNNLARNIAFKVKKTRRPVALEPMNPYERRIIHSALQDNKFVETYSEGEEPYRHVVVVPKKQ
ncbi:MAG: RNA-binding cell elongation regulator Jag/EloR [Lachnospiraceae bacterium]|nr:RNA-binding cell elongation regulator Jag/EloR [Lachnospiraceae bacterium]